MHNITEYQYLAVNSMIWNVNAQKTHTQPENIQIMLNFFSKLVNVLRILKNGTHNIPVARFDSIHKLTWVYSQIFSFSSDETV